MNINNSSATTEYNSVYTNAVNDVQQNAQTQALGQTTTTATNIAASSLASNSSQSNVGSTVINMDSSAGTNPLNMQPSISNITNTNNITNNEQSSAMQRNFLPFLNEARARLGRQTSYPGSILNQTWHGSNRSQFDLHRTRTTLQMPEYNNVPTNAPTSPSSPPPTVPAHLRQLRAWRMNINNMLSFSTAPSTETLRSLITNTGNFRSGGANGRAQGPRVADDNINLLLQDGNDNNGDAAVDASGIGDRINGRTLRSFSDLGGASTSRQMLPNSRLTNASNPELNRHIDDNELNATANTTQQSNNNNNGNNTANNTNDDTNAFDEDVISNAVVTILSHVVRYLPFIFILCLKFLYDHMEGILDLVFLHLIMHHMNKSLRKQVSKLSQKSYTIIFRDITLLSLVVIYRLIITSTPPDPFGLLITPPLVTTTVTVQLGPALLDTQVASTQTTPPPKVASNIIEGLPLGLLLYYVAINDLVLKLLTILIKNFIVLMPTRIIRHKQRSRLYVILEYTSQLYRAMVPIHEWIKFLYESYTGFEVISGILFSTFYMCSKGFEFVHRGQPLKKAIMIFVRNLDSQRRPTVSELGSAGGVCPICHDNYNTPVVLECNHIFCDACVNTWFKREQTCPMCRAKINIDPNWEDGATTYFYQLC